MVNTMAKPLPVLVKNILNDEPDIVCTLVESTENTHVFRAVSKDRFCLELKVTANGIYITAPSECKVSEQLFAPRVQMLLANNGLMFGPTEHDTPRGKFLSFKGDKYDRSI